MFSKAKQFTKDILARRNDIRDKAVPHIKKARDYAIENPSDVMLGIMTLMLMDLESEVDDLEEITSISASVDYHNYFAK